jgi:hypothetical protein
MKKHMMKEAEMKKMMQGKKSKKTPNKKKR